MEAFPYYHYYLFILALHIVIVSVISISPTVFRCNDKKSPNNSFQSLCINLNQDLIKNTLIVLAMSYFAFATGMIAGNSRNPISDTVLTTLLTVYGGLAAYWFSKNREENLIVSAISLIAFILFVHYGLHVGSSNRILAEQADRKYTEELKMYEAKVRVWEYAEKNKRIPPGVKK